MEPLALRTVSDDGEVLEVTRTCRIPMRELDFRFTPSGGPGGQHANRSNTRVEVRFDVAGSPSLGPRQRERLVAKLGPELRVVADDERSQYRNRQIALARLASRLAGGLRVETPRVATRPTKGSQRRRVEAKRATGERKRTRNRRWSADE